MSRPTARFVHATCAAVAVTGLAYGWMRYLLEPVDEFAIVNHPWQTSVRAWHVVAAPAFVFACGLVWRTHVWGRIVGGFAVRRRTGIALAALFVPMGLSGYLVQVSADEGWHLAWIWVHGVTGVVWIALYLAHQVSARE